MKLSLRLFGFIGLLLFFSGFALTYSVPGFVEDISKNFIKNKIIEQTNKKINTLESKTKNPSFNKLLGKLMAKNTDQIEAYKIQLKNKAHEKIVEVMAQMSDMNCECRKKYSQRIQQHFQFKISSFNQINEKLRDFMSGKYMETANKLKKILEFILELMRWFFFY